MIFLFKHLVLHVLIHYLKHYDKIDLNKEYGIHLDNEEKTIIFVLKVNPEKFINLIFNKNY